MRAPDALLVELNQTIDKLKTKFLLKALSANSLSPVSESDALDVTAFVVLSHAAFEEYFEEVAIWVLDQTVDAWKAGRRPQSVSTLLLHWGAKSEIKDDTPSSRAFERIKKELEEIKIRFSRQLKEKNHGMAEKYLRKMLYPLSIDITEDPNLLASLKAFARQRGSAAHKSGQGVERKISPQDTQVHVNDCLKLAEDVQKKAMKILLP